MIVADLNRFEGINPSTNLGQYNIKKTVKIRSKQRTKKKLRLDVTVMDKFLNTIKTDSTDLSILTATDS